MKQREHPFVNKQVAGGRLGILPRCLPETSHRRQQRLRAAARRRGRNDAAAPGQIIKILPFEPKEMRSDTYVHNFKHAIDAYYKGAQVSDYQKRNHFFEALSGQQRNAIGC